MKGIYLSPEDARRALIERRSLRPKIEAWWKKNGWEVPRMLLKNKCIAAFGHDPVATRRYCDIVFHEMAVRAGFTPTWMTYEQSVFTSASPKKRRLLHPVFFEKRGRRWGNAIVTRRHKLAGIEVNKKKRLSEITLDNGVSLLSFHHNLHSAFGLPFDSIIDLSPFYAHFDHEPRKYYIAYLSFFLAHAALFDDYHGGEDAREIMPFTREFFLPVFDRLKWEFGITPIVVRTPWHPDLALYPPSGDKNWALHGVIPKEMLRPKDELPLVRSA